MQSTCSVMLGGVPRKSNYRRTHTFGSRRGPVKNPLTNTTVFQLVAQIQDPPSKWKIQPNFPGPLLSFLLNVLNVPNPIPVYTSPNFWVVATGTVPGKPGAVPQWSLPGLSCPKKVPKKSSNSFEPSAWAGPSGGVGLGMWRCGRCGMTA